jgi:hypothetical protein
MSNFTGAYIMKLALLTSALLFLFSNSVMAGIYIDDNNIILEGKEIKKRTAVSDHGQHVVFWLFGDLAKATYGYMKDKAEGSTGSCAGTIKHFPGFLCLNGGSSFECLIKINMEKGLLEGSSSELCEHRVGGTKKLPLTAERVEAGSVGDGWAAFDIVGNTAKMLYNKMTINPVDNPDGKAGCFIGALKRFSGLECALIGKKRYACDIRINLENKRMKDTDMC